MSQPVQRQRKFTNNFGARGSLVADSDSCTSAKVERSLRYRRSEAANLTPSRDRHTARMKTSLGPSRKTLFAETSPSMHSITTPPNRSCLTQQRELADLSARALVIIGDPLTRFTEDPVRMIRCSVFGKTWFEIDPSLEIVIKKNAALLQLVAPARLFEEFLKLSLAGQSESTFKALNDLNLLHPMFPFKHQTHQLTALEKHASHHR